MTRIAAAFVLLIAQPAWHGQAGAANLLKDIEIDHSNERRMRGAEIVMDICMSCHDLRYLKYRNLVDLGFSETALLQKHINQDLGSSLASAMSLADREAMFGRLPPDLSLVVSAREGGARYVYSLFTSYQHQESGATINVMRPDIKMPDIFGYASITDDQTRTTTDERIHDVAAFLHWVSDPHESERRELGYYVIGYLAVLTLLFYLVKRRVWYRLRG